MRRGQAWQADELVAVEQQVEIQRAGPLRSARMQPKRCSISQAGASSRASGQVGFQLRDRVDEFQLLGDADRCRAVKR